jgi:hypothetical protein
MSGLGLLTNTPPRFPSQKLLFPPFFIFFSFYGKGIRSWMGKGICFTRERYGPRAFQRKISANYYRPAGQRLFMLRVSGKTFCVMVRDAIIPYGHPENLPSGPISAARWK